jgi:integrase
MRRRFGSITKVGKDRYRVQLTYGRDPITAKSRRFDETVRGSEAAAERRLNKFLIDAGYAPTRKDLTLEEYLRDYWLPHKENEVREKTWVGYESKLRTLVYPGIGCLRLNQVDAYSLDTWSTSLIGKVGETSRHHVVRILKSALEQGETWGFIGEKQAAKIEKMPVPAMNEPPIVVIEAADGIRLLAGFVGHHVEPAVIIAMSAGLRVSEVCGLDWSDIDVKDVENGTVSVASGVHQSKRRGLYVEDPKSKRSKRVVPLPDWASARLKTLRRLGPLFVDCKGKRRSPSSVSYHYKKRALELEGVPFVPLRNLRHTYATDLLEAGVPLEIISGMMGHSTLEITRRHYVKVGTTIQRAAAKKLDAHHRAATRDISRETAGDDSDSLGLNQTGGK